MGETEVSSFVELAQDMMVIACKYEFEVEEVHKLYYSVSCDRNKLIGHLNGDKSVQLWSELEDLALRDQNRGLMYIHVVKLKGEDEVQERKRFLEIE